MNHAQIAELLNEMDLHIFPSRSEGFPKVTLENSSHGSTFCCIWGLWCFRMDKSTGKNGFVVDTIDEIEAVVKNLQQHPNSLILWAKEAIKLAKSFDWKVLVKDWEKVIETVYNK